MDITIRPLTPDLVEDYLAFFDGPAFADHAEWSWCYCMFFHEAGVPDPGEPDKEGQREKARRLIEAGTQKGYLAYAAGRVVGWCCAGDKAGFARLAGDKALWADGDGARVKAVVCFLVPAEDRGRGVASALLDRACRDAAEEGYDCLEAYPLDEGADCFANFHGYGAMYAKHGFVPHRTLEGRIIVRKAARGE